MPIAVGVPDDVAAYIRDRYGSALLADITRVEIIYVPGDLITMVITVIKHREKREGEV